MNTLAYTLFIGIGATAVFDLWSIARRAAFNVPAPDFKLVGRWFAYVVRGRFRHDAIKVTPAVKGEAFIGWTMHYAIGIAFAALLLLVQGIAWFERPTLTPALIVGLVTVAAPFLVLQPGMGQGIAASRAANPHSARIQSVVAHAIFGVGLYLAGRLVNLLFL